MDQQPKPSDSKSVPSTDLPVESAKSRGGVDGFVMFPTLEEARGHNDVMLCMEADFGGQTLLTCQAKHVRATQAVLEILLADLECITWGGGLIPEEQALNTDNGACLSFSTFVPVICAEKSMLDNPNDHVLWLHSELEDEWFLRGLIERVLSGVVDRLEVPRGVPAITWKTIRQAKASRRGRVQIRSGAGGRLMLNAAAKLVQLNEIELMNLARDMDRAELAALLPHLPDGGANYKPRDPLIQFVDRIRYGWSGPVEDDCCVHGPHNRALVLQALRERRFDSVPLKAATDSDQIQYAILDDGTSRLELGWKPRDVWQRLQESRQGGYRREGNFIRVHGRVRCPEGTWDFADACLTQLEALDLSDFLDVRPWAGGASTSFIEPCLEFFTRGASNDRLRLGTRFRGEVSPPWILDDLDQVWHEGFTLGLHVTDDELRRFANELRGMLGLST